MKKLLPFILISSVLRILSAPIALNTENLNPVTISALVIWFCYAPLIYALEGKSARIHFFSGYVFGILSATGMLFWVMVALQKYGNLNAWTSLGIMLALIGAHSIFPAISFWSIARLRGIAPRWIAGPVVFMLVDWILGFFPIGGFPWVSPAYSLAGSLQLIQSADLVGIYGLNILIFVVNFILAEILISRDDSTRRFPKVAAVAVVLVFLGNSVYGYVKLGEFEETSAQTGKTYRFALIQGNIRQDLKWDTNTRRMIIETYRELSHSVDDKEPNFIVWPEASLPFPIEEHDERIPVVAGISRSSEFIVGGVLWTRESGELEYRNSAFLVRPDGDIASRYDKQHLVPFGEYVPLNSVLPIRNYVPAVAGNFSEGKDSSLFHSQGTSLGILICYEVLFPELGVQAVGNGAEILVNITNDAWFDRTSGPHQHYHFAIFRAIELRRTIVRVANTGFSAIFHPNGKAEGKTELFQKALLVKDIAPTKDRSFYSRYPHLMHHLSFLFLFLCALGVFRSRAKE